MRSNFKWTAFTVFTLLSACEQGRVPAVVPDHLILLTKSGSDHTEASFLAVDNLEHCETRAAGAHDVFPAAGITYIAHYCVTSEQAFEPFSHGSDENGSDENARTYIFDLTLSKDGQTLMSATPYASMNACEKAKGSLCVTSSQNRID